MNGLSAGPRQTIIRSSRPSRAARRKLPNAVTESWKNMTPNLDPIRSTLPGSNG